MGWQDRDWATWTGEERDRLLAGMCAPARTRLGIRSRCNELTLLAMLVSLAASLTGWQFHLFRLPISPSAADVVPTAPVVYGIGLAHTGASRMTCTAMAADGRRRGTPPPAVSRRRGPRGKHGFPREASEPPEGRLAMR